ncbi:MAG: diacylglycerol kinase family protein [Candidatus Saccharimonas sp.]
MTIDHSLDRRLVIVENPRNSNARKVAREVFGLLEDHGICYEHITTRYSDAESNSIDLAEQLRDGDRVIAAAGDGTGSQLANAILRSDVDAEAGFLPYGNFNDLASTYTKLGSSVLDLIGAETVTSIPLAITVNGSHWRYAPAYATIGWSAAAAGSFDHTVSRYMTRNTLPSLKRGASLAQVVYQYYRHRVHYLPDFATSNDKAVHHHLTDIMAINGPIVAGSIGTDRCWYDSSQFGYKELDVSRFFPNVIFGLQALTRQMPLNPAQTVTISFNETTRLPIQTEGEHARIDAHQVTISKNHNNRLMIVSTKT